MTRLLAAFWLLLLAFATPAAAQNFPKLTGRVVDNAHLLNAAQVVDITSKSEALEAQSGRQFVVTTVPSLGGQEIEQYSYELGRAWGIGQKDKNDGVILVVAPNERKVWIATGYGAGAYVTDAMAGVITREEIRPHFKQSPPDYGGGVVAGADAIIKQMSLPPEEAQKNAASAEHAQKARRQESGGGVPVAFIVMIIAFIILSRLRRVGGRRYYRRHGGVSPWVVLWGLNELSRGSRGSNWGGGSSWSGGGGSSWGGGGGFGGGGFSGGGGSFGGGGAGGSW